MQLYIGQILYRQALFIHDPAVPKSCARYYLIHADKCLRSIGVHSRRFHNHILVSGPVQLNKSLCLACNIFRSSLLVFLKWQWLFIWPHMNSLYWLIIWPRMISLYWLYVWVCQHGLSTSMAILVW